MAPQQPTPIKPVIKPSLTGLSDMRCPKCNRLLLRLSWADGTPLHIEIVCPKCGTAIEQQEQAA